MSSCFPTYFAKNNSKGIRENQPNPCHLCAIMQQTNFS